MRKGESRKISLKSLSEKGFFVIGMIIVSKQNAAVKELASLKEKKGRRARGSYLVEGEKMVRECVKSGQEIVRLIVREDYAGETYGLETLTLGRDAFSSVCDCKTPQGIAAEVVLPMTALVPPQKRCLLLDGVSDPSNVGAIVRTAVAAGYEELYLVDCADPYSPKSVRSSMSGIFFARLMQGSREEVLRCLDGVDIVAADMNGENIFSFTPPRVFALAIGNEGNGLSASVRERAAHTVRIPMGQHTESLNAAVSAGILMYLLKKPTF